MHTKQLNTDRVKTMKFVVFSCLSFLLVLAPAQARPTGGICKSFDICEEEWWKTTSTVIIIWVSVWGTLFTLAVIVGFCCMRRNNWSEDDGWDLVAYACLCTCPCLLPCGICCGMPPLNIFYYLCHKKTDEQQQHY